MTLFDDELVLARRGTDLLFSPGSCRLFFIAITIAIEIRPQIDRDPGFIFRPDPGEKVLCRPW
jgi:hypothetical protein